jgi:hypothetical protein
LRRHDGKCSKDNEDNFKDWVKNTGVVKWSVWRYANKIFQKTEKIGTLLKNKDVMEY